jgi:hypothetical protein
MLTRVPVFWRVSLMKFLVEMGVVFSLRLHRAAAVGLCEMETRMRWSFVGAVVVASPVASMDVFFWSASATASCM